MKHPAFIILLFVLYIILMTALMIWQGIGIAPDRYIFVLLLGSLFIKRTRSFLLDWMPFLFILISYDFLRSFSDNLNVNIHVTELIDLERAIFGFIPTEVLQAKLFDPNNLQWYDYYTTIFYFLHFALPLSFGFLLWIFNKSYFRRFVTGVSMMSYTAWVTYLVYPAAPPWLAARDGFLTGIHKVLNSTLNFFPERISLPTIYHQFTPNEVAAIPSMHAAYPFLVLLFSLRFFGFKALFFLPYVFSLWFSIVYLGEHYVVDIISGIVYAIIFYFITEEIFHRFNWEHLLIKFKNWFSKQSRNV